MGGGGNSSTMLSLTAALVPTYAMFPGLALEVPWTVRGRRQCLRGRPSVFWRRAFPSAVPLLQLLRASRQWHMWVLWLHFPSALAPRQARWGRSAVALLCCGVEQVNRGLDCYDHCFECCIAPPFEQRRHDDHLIASTTKRLLMPHPCSPTVPRAIKQVKPAGR